MVRLTDEIALIGGPDAGPGGSEDDCNVYVIATADGPVVIDTGVGRGIDDLIEMARRDGLPLNGLAGVLLTHAHLDHSGGAHLFGERFAAPVHGSAETARRVSTADEKSIALPEARRAGMYRASDSLRPVPVWALEAGTTGLEIGGVRFVPIPTPGHSSDHTAYLADVGGRRILLAGDLLFPGGAVALLNTHDCCLAALVTSLEALRDLEFDALLAGHLAPRLENATEDRDIALDALDRLVLPRSIV